MKTQNALLAERCDQRDGGEDGGKADPACFRILCDECNTTHAHTAHAHAHAHAHTLHTHTAHCTRTRTRAHTLATYIILHHQSIDFPNGTIAYQNTIGSITTLCWHSANKATASDVSPREECAIPKKNGWE